MDARLLKYDRAIRSARKRRHKANLEMRGDPMARFHFTALTERIATVRGAP